MPKVTIRRPRLSDAKRFFEILSNPNFIYITTKVKSAEEEKKWIKNEPERRKNNIEQNYAILYGKQMVGAIGVKINYHRKYVGEIGYFLDENFWNKGITTKAVRLVEKEGFKKLGLERIEIAMQTKNKASEKVAIKCNYKKEGLLKKALRGTDGKMKDAFLYAKVR